MSKSLSADIAVTPERYVGSPALSWRYLVFFSLSRKKNRSALLSREYLDPTPHPPLYTRGQGNVWNIPIINLTPL